MSLVLTPGNCLDKSLKFSCQDFGMQPLAVCLDFCNLDQAVLSSHVPNIFPGKAEVLKLKIKTGPGPGPFRRNLKKTAGQNQGQ